MVRIRIYLGLFEHRIARIGENSGFQLIVENDRLLGGMRFNGAGSQTSADGKKR